MSGISNANSKNIRVLLDDGMQIRLGTGIGKCCEQLGLALEAMDGIELEYLAFGDEDKGRRGARLDYLRYINSKEFAQRAVGFDLCIFGNYSMPFRRLATRTATAIYDLTAYDYPETLPAAYRPYSRAMIRNSVKHADLIVADSRTIMDAISARFPRAAGKVTYVWPGLVESVGRAAADAAYESGVLADVASGPFFLMVGTVEKRKNVELVIRAFSELKRLGNEFGSHQLVLAGRPGYGYEEIEAAAKASGCEDSIVFTGYVSDHDLANLYRDAQAMVFPSVYEGFGMTQVECMAMHLPIILSDIPTSREVSEGYGVFFKLGDVAGLCNAMASVARGVVDRARLAEVADARLSEFSWVKVAKTFLAAAGPAANEVASR